MSDSWVADLDQMKAALRDMSGVCWSFYSDLRGSGFEASEALALTLAFFTDTMRGHGDES